MSLFNRYEKKIYSPVCGKKVRLEDLPDERFRKEMLGPSIAFDSADGNVYAPADGKIVMVTDSKHAIGLRTKFGAEILIHIGIDTVELNGCCFDEQIRKNQIVHRGELLIKFDKVKICNAGYDPSIIVIVTNAKDNKIHLIEKEFYTLEDAILEFE